MFDAYAHVGLPRFLGAERYLGLMADLGVERALVCAFDACPDVREVHRAVALGEGRIVGLGLPLGRDGDDLSANMLAQLDLGLVGARFSESDLLDRSAALRAVAERDGLVLVVGNDGLAAVAETLLDHLEANPTARVVAAHFAGPMDPTGISEGTARLLDHPRFAVVFSRQGFFPAERLQAWSAMLVERLGWDRIMWGSEAPVLFWRDEPLSETPAWIDRFSPDDAQRERFFRTNAYRFIFRRAVDPKPFDLEFDPFDFDAGRKSPFFPFGLDIGSATGGRLVEGWLAWGGEARGPLSAYLDEVLQRALPALPR